jgi:hypothetical protein
VWLGFWVVPIVPSPKFQDQEAGFPEDRSVNCTDWPVAGEVGLKEKEAASASATVRDWLEALEPEPFVAVKVTVFAPAVA